MAEDIERYKRSVQEEAKFLLGEIEGRAVPPWYALRPAIVQLLKRVAEGDDPRAKARAPYPLSRECSNEEHHDCRWPICVCQCHTTRAA